MLLRPITIDLADYPSVFHDLLAGSTLYDSSCSEDATVIFIDRDAGYFLKTADEGALASEADRMVFFHRLGLGPACLSYCVEGRDYLLSRKLAGVDCTADLMLADPKRLVDVLAEALLRLHSCDPLDAGRSTSLVAYGDRLGDLELDCLIHGDACLPNYIFDDWRFRGFVDLGAAGLGDRHIDIYWVLWSLNYNLKSDGYRDRFLDAYGRALIDEDRLELVARVESGSV